MSPSLFFPCMILIWKKKTKIFLLQLQMLTVETKRSVRSAFVLCIKNFKLKQFLCIKRKILFSVWGLEHRSNGLVKRIDKLGCIIVLPKNTIKERVYQPLSKTWTNLISGCSACTWPLLLTWTRQLSVCIYTTWNFTLHYWNLWAATESHHD